jgi:hypothetical protein
VYVYRTPDGKFDIFLSNLQLIIQKIAVKNKILIRCGDWSIKFLYKNSSERKLNYLLSRYNLKCTVNVPTRITKSSSTLLDVLIINEKNFKRPLVVMGLVLNHNVQALFTPFQNCNTPHRIKSRLFREDNIWEFFYLLTEVTWQQVYVESDVNAKFEVFIYIFLYYNDTAFAIKTVYWRESVRRNCITQGMKVSSKRMRFLDNLRKKFALMRKIKIY